MTPKEWLKTLELEYKPVDRIIICEDIAKHQRVHFINLYCDCVDYKEEFPYGYHAMVTAYDNIINSNKS